jgi:tetratricopeptide (TPR) repeat protein
LAINPKDEDALYEKGVFLDKLGNHTGAIEYFDKALAIYPHDIDALNHKGAALNSLGNYTGSRLRGWRSRASTMPIVTRYPMGSLVAQSKDPPGVRCQSSFVDAALFQYEITEFLLLYIQNL